jgi:molybdopterin molybdotransferase
VLLNRNFHRFAQGKRMTHSHASAPERLLSIEEALKRIVETTTPVADTETVLLRLAFNRYLAADIVTPLNVPSFDASAMDGYAFRHADLGKGKSEGKLKLAGSISAGHPMEVELPRGCAARILTGAPLPKGADTVAMQEHCRANGKAVFVPGKLLPGDNRRLAGDDVHAGSVILKAGQRLRAQDISLAAAAGSSSLPVFRKLKAAVLSSGDELCEPGQLLPTGCIYDSNRTTAAALLESLGLRVTDLGILPDQPEIIRSALVEAAIGHDLVLTSGGMSEGDEDHMRAAVEAEGKLDFWKLAIKPGKPIAVGRINNVPFVGLPGNPVAVMIGFLLLVRPLALRLMGAMVPELPRFPVTADFDFKRKPGRREWLRGRVEAKSGQLLARKFTSESSGALSSMVWADGLIEIPEAMAEIKQGDRLHYLPFNGLLS